MNMMRRSMSSVALVVMATILPCSPISGQEAAFSPVDEFATNGLDIGNRVIGEPIDNVIEEFGLPTVIDIHRDRAQWDIDVEETPVEWVYAGLAVTTRYLRSGESVEGVRTLVPGPYREDRTVVEVRVFDSNAPVLFGLRVGVSADEVLSRLGAPPRYEPSHTAIVYYAELPSSSREVAVRFSLDDPGGNVREVVWQLEAWH